LNLALLGVPTVQHAGRDVTFRTRKALALLVYLAVEGGIHSREELAALFWPESDHSKGRATLRSTLAYMRRALRSPSPGSEKGAGNGGYLIIERDTLGFNFEAKFEADWLTLQAAWTAARSPARLPASGKTEQLDGRPTPAALLTQLQTAANLYRGDFLTGFSLEDAPDFDNWASTQRESCHRQMGLVFDRLSQLQAEGGELISAVTTASRWVALDPLNEMAHRRLMQLHFAGEDRSAALLAYEACQTILTRELNAEPTPETQALADRIRAADFAVRSSDLGLNLSDPTSEIQHHKSVELPLVGRSNEHLALVTAYRAVRRGQPQAVILEGEPGIGKTRLAQEFLGWAAAQGADVLQGRAFEVSSRLPYQAVIEALRDRLERENAPDDLLSDLWLAELSRLLPELRDRYPDLPPPSDEATSAQMRLFEAAARLCQALADRAPLILFLDDLQWADAATLDLLLYACRRWAAASSPMLLLFTLRPEELAPIGESEPNLKLSDWLITLDREIALTQLTLEPLTLADIKRLVESSAFSTTVDRPTSTEQQTIKEEPLSSVAARSSLDRFSRQLFAETGGQPFFLIETLRTLFEPDRLPADGGGNKRLETREPPGVDFNEVLNGYLQAGDQRNIPPSVQQMISARLAHLSSSAQSACLSAAVLGDSFDFERLRSVAGLSESNGLDALEELLKRGLLREQRQASTRPYVLAHDHFREVVYNQAAAARRRVLHRRALDALEAIAAPPAELARHAWAAGLLERAFELDVASAEEAIRLYAPQAAIQHFARALEAAQQSGITPAPQVYHARGRAQETVGNFEGAQNDFQLALEEAQARDDHHSQWRALQDLGFLWASREYDQAGDYFQQALALARNMGEPKNLARSLNRVGNWHANIEQPAEAIDFHQEALAILEDLAERPGQADTLDLLGMACYMVGDMGQSLAYYERAVALFRELDNRRGLVSSQAMMSMVVRATFTVEVPPGADMAQSVPMAESAVQTARDIGWRAGESHALMALGQNLFHQGQYEHALNSIQAGLDVAVEIEHSLWMTYGHWALGLIHLDLLALPQAQQHLEQSLTLARETGSMFWLRISTSLLALIFIAQGELAQAESLLEGMIGSKTGRPDSVEWSAQTTMQRVVWYVRAELALACREPRLALQIVEQLIAATTNITKERPVARLSKLRGEALTALGQTTEAEAALRAAQAIAAAQGETPLLWRIHLGLGRLYQTQDRVAEATDEFAAAQAIIDELAANISDGALRENFRQGATNLW
jgi:DNA-binding SARP family transcriptional activator